MHAAELLGHGAQLWPQKMSIVGTDWKSFLFPDFDLPPGVVFLENEVLGPAWETLSEHETFACCLAGVRPVFFFFQAEPYQM